MVVITVICAVSFEPRAVVLLQQSSETHVAVKDRDVHGEREEGSSGEKKLTTGNNNPSFVKITLLLHPCDPSIYL